MTLMLVQQVGYVLQLMMDAVTARTQCSSFTLNIPNKRLTSTIYKELSHTDIKKTQNQKIRYLNEEYNIR